MLTLARMRLPVLGLATIQLLLVTSAYAGRTGGGGGGGRLGQVSGGISRATSSASSSSSSSSSNDSPRDHRSGSSYSGYRREWRDCPTDVMPNDFGRNPPPSTRRSSSWCTGRYIAVIDSDGTVVREYQPSMFDGGTANVDGFLGVHKVVESNSAISASLSFDDRWFRVGGTLTRYQERQMDGSDLTLTMPAFTVGLRITGAAGPRVFLEGGFAVVKTHNEPMGDSSITGTKLGIHAEHRFGGSGNPALILDAHTILFSEENVRAVAGRVGLRVSHLELAFRVLDFNVGPALYGPEVGLQF